jgi:NAD(P)-dependent dehydrogenase (short-subunit alcohol dehydrogenase family)
MSEPRLAGKIAFISGGASGIGEACAQRFVAEGAKVVIGDLDGDRAAAVAATLGGAARHVTLDVTQEESWRAAIASVAALHGRLDVLVNSAGISIASDIESGDFALWQRHQKVNADGVFLGCKYGLGLMKDTTRAGSIVNLSSTLGLRAHADFVAYGASKAAVWSITRSVALHCCQKAYPVRCNAVHPGATLTPMMQGVLDSAPDPAQLLEILAAGHPMKRVGQPQELASAILFLASDEASFITGVSLPVDGGYCAA